MKISLFILEMFRQDGRIHTNAHGEYSQFNETSQPYWFLSDINVFLRMRFSQQHLYNSCILGAIKNCTK